MQKVFAIIASTFLLCSSVVPAINTGEVKIPPTEVGRDRKKPCLDFTKEFVVNQQQTSANADTTTKVTCAFIEEEDDYKHNLCLNDRLVQEMCPLLCGRCNPTQQHTNRSLRTTTASRRSTTSFCDSPSTSDELLPSSKISVGMITMPHSFTEGAYGIDNTAYNDTNPIPPYSPNHSIMLQYSKSGAQIYNANYRQRVKHLASLIHCKRWKVTLIYMLADEYFGGYKSKINLWPGPRDGDASDPGGSYTDAILGPDLLLSELDTLSGERGRYKFTYDKNSGYLHGHFKMRLKFSNTGPFAPYGLGDDDEWWSNPMSNMVLIDTHHIEHDDEAGSGFDEQIHYADGGVHLPWWLLDNQRLAEPAYSGGIPYSKEAVWDRALVLSKLKVRDEKTGLKQSIVFGMLQLPPFNILRAVQQTHSYLNNLGGIPLEGYPFDPPYEESLDIIIKDIGRIAEKYNDLLSKAAALAKDSPLLLLVADQFQIFDPSILGFHTLPFASNMTYNASTAFGKPYGIMDNPHSVLEGESTWPVNEMYAISKNLIADPIKTGFPGLIDIFPTVETDSSGHTMAIKVVEKTSTIYANNRVSYETIISMKPSTKHSAKKNKKEKVEKDDKVKKATKIKKSKKLKKDKKVK